MLTFQEFRRIRKTYLTESRLDCKRFYSQYVKQKKIEMNINEELPRASVSCAAPCSFNIPTVNSLGWLEPIPVFDSPAKQEGNNPMNYATATVQAATTETQDQRKYLERRLQEVYSDKRDGLEATFGLIDDEPPSGATELKERLEKGAYTFRTGEQFRYWHWTDLIQWRDPAKKQDHDGFKAALEELKALKQKSLDTIKIEDPKTGLDAVKALEAWTPTGAAS